MSVVLNDKPRQSTLKWRWPLSRELTLSVATLAVLLAVWWAVAALQLISPLFLPPPGQVLQKLITIAGPQGFMDATLWQHLAASLTRIVIALLAAVLIGVPVGIAMGLNSTVRGILDPLIELYRPVPPLAYLPLMVIWFGIGETSKILLIYLAIFAPVAMSALAGVKSAQQVRIRAARSLGASRAQVLWLVILPGALPEILTGLRIGLGVGWSTLVAAELIAATRGLGFMVQSAGEFLATDVVLAGIAVIAIIAFLLELGLRALQRRVLLAVALPEVNHFAIGGAAQAFGLVQFAFEQRPVFRTGDGAFGFKPPRQPFAQLFKVLIAAAGKLASAGLGIEPARPGDLLADAHRQAAVAPAKHLLHQQEQRQVVGDQRTGVKQGAVAGVNPRRQQRGAIFCRQLNKAGVPFFIADAATGEAGDFPRREEDQHPAGLQLLVHLLQRRFSGAAMNIIYRDKQRAQGLKVGEHAVGDHFDIAAHAGYRIQERQAVEGAGGVVGDNDQRAIFGDLFEIVRRDGAADIEVFQHLFDRIKPLQVAVTVGKLLKLFLIK